ncbi:MAG: SDR family NAD(P)-dependent oxidoreductase [Planctomycetota bacterium]|jgi:NAD(P)-dependent dehydrogenase (short-subunit alcohol dehydrogenase family)
MELNGKVALVTGSSRGIGKTIALELAGKGCKVIVHGSRDSNALCRSFEEVNKLSQDSVMVTAELSEPAAIDKMFSQIKKTFTGLDILINNAAAQNPSPILELKQADWDYVLSVNLRAPFLCAQHAAKMMCSNKAGGKIVNISSVHAYDARRYYAHYSASKGALETLTKSLALELAQYNIQVNSIVAGAIATELTPLDRQSKFLTSIPAGRIGTTEEIAHLVAFLSSNQCDYLTGASITVDGGLTLGFCASRPDL